VARVVEDETSEVENRDLQTLLVGAAAEVEGGEELAQPEVAQFRLIGLHRMSDVRMLSLVPDEELMFAAVYFDFVDTCRLSSCGKCDILNVRS
jgi:hypothetical protein